MPRYLTLLGFVALVAASACASAGEAGAARGSGNVITAEQIATVHASNVFEAVQQLRPQFLRQRGTATIRGGAPEGQPTGAAAQSGTELVVYLDGVRAGGVEVLRNMPVDRVEEVRYLDARDATTLYGTGHVGGAIEVKSRR